jgi:hypothetical protein
MADRNSGGGVRWAAALLRINEEYRYADLALQENEKIAGAGGKWSVFQGFHGHV